MRAKPESRKTSESIVDAVSTPQCAGGAAGDPGASAPPSYHHGDLRNALIAAGRAALEELGPRELSLRSVAKMVGVSEAAPSRHFAGKEGLLAAMAAQGFAELAEKRRHIVESDRTIEDKVRQMMNEYVRFAQQQKGLFNLMVGPRIVQPGIYEELRECTSASFNLFADTVCDFGRACGWTEPSLHLLVHAAWAVEHGLATLILGGRAPASGRPVDVNDMIEFSISLFIERVAAGPGA